MTAMNCPVCCAPFREVAKDGVLIDICTQCRGIWLDRGELDKLLDIAHKKYERQVVRWFDDDGDDPAVNKKRKT